MIFIPCRFASTTLSLEYTSSSAGLSARIDHFAANNVTALPATLSVHLVPSGGTADDSNKQLVVEIEGGKAYLCAEIVGADLGTGESIWVLSDTADAISIRANGRVV